MYHFCSENRLSKILFSNPFPQKRSDCESQKSRFRFDPKNPPLSVDFMDSWSVFGFVKKTRKIRFWIRKYGFGFSQKNAPNVAPTLQRSDALKKGCCESSLVTSPLATTTRRQRERKKNNRVYWTKQQVCTYITLLCTFVTARQGRENA